MRWRIMLKTSLSMIHRCPGLHCYHGTQVQLQEMESVCVSRLVTSDLCNPMDYSPPGSSVQGILQARILEWIAISFSRGSSWPRDQIQVSCIAGRFFSIWAKGKVTLNLLWLFSWYLSRTKSLKSYMAFYKINIFLEHWDGRLSSVTGPVIF